MSDNISENLTNQMFTLNSVLGTGTLLLEIFLASIILLYIFNKSFLEKLIKVDLPKYFKVEFTSKNLLILIFLFSFASSILTLIYSEYFGQIPCALCWFGRIFMYGIVILSGIALAPLSNGEGLGVRPHLENFQLKNIFIFSILGALVSLYHHFLQITAGSGSHLPCPASSGDCAKILVFEYGHITFPWMAFVLFVFFMFALHLYKRYN